MALLPHAFAHVRADRRGWGLQATHEDGVISAFLTWTPCEGSHAPAVPVSTRYVPRSAERLRCFYALLAES